MDVIFDIDGTLANAEHRLHFIKDMSYWKPGGVTRDLKPDWDSFLADEQVAKDAPIGPIWRMLDLITCNTFQLKPGHERVIFVTGRKEDTRDMTREWLNRYANSHTTKPWAVEAAPLYMRSNGDRRPSHEVKRDLLKQVREDGYDPRLCFEDRKDDTAMWRSEGILCCQVAEGNY